MSRPFIDSALLVVGIAVLPTATVRCEESPVGADETSPVVVAVRDFLATLDDDSRSRVVFPFDADERRRWGRSPSPRPGIACKDMTDEQSALLDRLLDAVLSDDGIAAVKAIRSEQNVLGRNESGLGDGYFWLAFYGEPGVGRWAWRLGGHHLSLHATYDGDAVVSVTPMHMGGEVAGDEENDSPGYRSLRGREERVRSFVDSMNKDQWLAAHADAVAPGSLLLSEPNVKSLTPSRDGLSMSDIDGSQRAMVDALVNEYLRTLDAPLAATIREQYESIRPKARFRWRGTKTPGDPHYYCIHGRGFLIESINSGNHVHTILRTDADWGDAAEAAR